MPKTPPRKTTPEELDYIRDNIGKCPFRHMDAHLGRHRGYAWNTAARCFPEQMPPKRLYRFWTTGEIRTLREMTRAGRSRREISAALGRSTADVKAKAGQLGGEFLPHGPRHAWTDEELHTLTDMARQGHSLKGISAALGRCEGGCHKKLRSIFGQKPLTHAREENRNE